MHSVSVFGKVVRVGNERDVNNSTVLDVVVKSVRTYGEKEYATYWDCSLWGARSKTMVSVGDIVGVQGEVRAGVYTNKSGEARGKLMLTVKSISVEKFQDAAPAVPRPEITGAV